MRFPLSKFPAGLLAVAGVAVAGVAVAGGCAAYRMATRDALVRWFLALGPCIYRADNWQAAFFTPGTKAAGNRYAAVGVLFGLLVAAYGIWRLLRSRRASAAEVTPLDRPYQAAAGKPFWTRDVWLWAVLLFAAGAWGWGMSVVVPCYDEVFSAIDCAAMHPFQAWSYYMLPNNHVLLNVVNSLIPIPADDKLLSARLLAFGAYLTLAALWYRWLARHTGHRALAALLTAVLLLQFPVWAFGFQGRGYELCCLAGWAALLCTDRHQRLPADRRPLRVATAAAIAGFAVVPTYLYFHAALVLWSATGQLAARRPDLRFWKHQVFTAAGVFLFYLPVLLFSGLPALTENHYVRQGTGTAAEFLPAALGWIIQVVQFCFGGFVDARKAVYLIAFLLPGLLLLAPRRAGLRNWGRAWCCLWLCVLLLLLQKRRVPFVRSLTTQYSMTLAFALLTVHALLQAGARRLKRPWVAPAGLVAVALAAGVHFVRFDRDHVGDSIYMNDAAARYRTLAAGLQRVPAGSGISVSAESFYWEYLARQRAYPVRRCPGEASDYYITDTAEARPAWLSGAYQRYAAVQEYCIYRRDAARPDTGSAR